MTRRIEIIRDATGEVVHTIETELTGSNYDKILLGLFRKTDLERFTVKEDDQ